MVGATMGQVVQCLRLHCMKYAHSCLSSAFQGDGRTRIGGD
jgi:hypothetical protein